MTTSDNELQFPFPETPAHGLPQGIAEDLFWVRLPLLFRLNHINVWLLKMDDCWAAIDCGTNSPEVRSIWKDLLAGNLRILIATHGHTDHIGLAGDLANGLDIPFFATPAEWLSATARYASRGMPNGSEKFFASHGCDTALTGHLSEAHHHLTLMIGPQPFSYQRLRDGEFLRLGKRESPDEVFGTHTMRMIFSAATTTPTTPLCVP